MLDRTYAKIEKNVLPGFWEQVYNFYDEGKDVS